MAKVKPFENLRTVDPFILRLTQNIKTLCCYDIKAEFEMIVV